MKSLEMLPTPSQLMVVDCIETLKRQKSAIEHVKEPWAEKVQESLDLVVSKLRVSTKPTTLAIEVYHVVRDATESFEEENVGADLAYLLPAILKQMVCLWDKNRPIVKLLRQHFPKAHPVWNHIRLEK